MTGSISNTTSLFATGMKGITRALENGTLKSMKIQVENATPQMQARLDANFQQAQAADAKLIAQYRAHPTWATFDDKNNSVALPDVQTLNKDDATHVLKGLQYLQDIGRLDGKTLIAKNGGQATDSSALYQDWLLARIGVDARA
ncbi:hypothetical protein NJH83_21525 [Pseudomonas chlororaphis]|uniref:hypothetical protein n=1 Tax=Pseudomonas chlororaphis TaxID=587753 RepID=UPI00209ACC89|nr:hypothetical protein [Pseudomonas chlororaphis]MCO7612816.1 hypothetical protein [Pseudomonas chlororaphis]